MNGADAVLAVAKEVLAARGAAAAGKPDVAIQHWRSAVVALDKLNYDEPPDEYYPVRESLGAGYLSTGKRKKQRRFSGRPATQSSQSPFAVRIKGMSFRAARRGQCNVGRTAVSSSVDKLGRGTATWRFVKEGRNSKAMDF